jgi:type III secretion protein V
MVDQLARALIYLSRRSDLIVAILMLVAIAMIIIPLPTWLVDGLIALNIMLSMLVLLVVFYIEKPVEFSSFPSVNPHPHTVSARDHHHHGAAHPASGRCR